MLTQYFAMLGFELNLGWGVLMIVGLGCGYVCIARGFHYITFRFGSLRFGSVRFGSFRRAVSFRFKCESYTYVTLALCQRGIPSDV